MIKRRKKIAELEYFKSEILMFLICFSLDNGCNKVMFLFVEVSSYVFNYEGNQIKKKKLKEPSTTVHVKITFQRVLVYRREGDWLASFILFSKGLFKAYFEFYSQTLVVSRTES
jgi:hypothetical protein